MLTKFDDLRNNWIVVLFLSFFFHHRAGVRPSKSGFLQGGGGGFLLSVGAYLDVCIGGHLEKWIRGSISRKSGIRTARIETDNIPCDGGVSFSVHSSSLTASIALPFHFLFRSIDLSFSSHRTVRFF